MHSTMCVVEEGLLLLDVWSLKAEETDRPGVPAMLREGISLANTVTTFAFSNILIPHDRCFGRDEGQKKAAAC